MRALGGRASVAGAALGVVILVLVACGGCGLKGTREGGGGPATSPDGLGAPAADESLDPFSPPPRIARLLVGHDEDGDGADDLDDIVAGARAYVATRPRYQDGYYAGGYPPDDVGVCTDVIWRALQAAGYDLKALVDADIAAEPEAYPRVAGRPDPNIDFRRVKNLQAFFGRRAANLTTDVRPGDAANLCQWQGGDIVVFAPPLQHIAVISDRRRGDGVPYILHNPGPRACEQDCLTSWPTPISGHFRFPQSE